MSTIKNVKIISLNIGLPREISYQGRMIETGIFKSPISRPVMARALNFDGDQQADLSVHGGRDKAIYGYPSEHYEYWRKELPGVDLPWGVFGENLTTAGLFEDSTYIGDRYRIGEVEVVVTQPRLPCFKLGLRFDRPDIIKRFLASRRSGFYFAVKKEGFIQTGDSIEIISRDPGHVSVTDIIRVYAFEKEDVETIKRAINVEALPESWRDYFQQQIEKQSG